MRSYERVDKAGSVYLNQEYFFFAAAVVLRTETDLRIALF